jgi:hypothetical protein
MAKSNPARLRAHPLEAQLQDCLKRHDLPGLVELLNGCDLYFVMDGPRLLNLLGSIRKQLLHPKPQDLPSIIQLAYREMITLTTYLTIRAGFPVYRALASCEAGYNVHDLEIPQEVRQALPALEALHEHLVHLTKAYASVMHTLALGNPSISAESLTKEAGGVESLPSTPHPTRLVSEALPESEASVPETLKLVPETQVQHAVA